MTYSNPAFGILHALRSVGGSAITSNNPITGTKKAYLFDSRRELFQFDSSETDHYLDVDLGTASPDAFDRLVIFDSHNVTGNLTVIQDTVGAFSSPTAILTAEPISSGVLFDVDLDSAVTEQYLRFYFPSGGGRWALPELWLTKRVTMATDDPAWPWDDSYRYNVIDSPKPSGDIASLELGPKQRVLRYSWPKLEAADQAILADLFDGPGRALPFLWWPPYNDQDVLLVKLSADPARQVGVLPPTTVEAHAVTLDLVELVT